MQHNAGRAERHKQVVPQESAGMPVECLCLHFLFSLFFVNLTAVIYRKDA